MRISRSISLLVLSLALCIPAPGSAQCHARTLVCGQTVTTPLSTSDCAASGSFFDVWRFQGIAGQRVQIDLASTAVNSLHKVYAPDGALVVTDNDGAPAANEDARIIGTTNSGGDWTIHATTAVAGQTGSYTLTLTCSSLTGCVQSNSTLCLAGGRFRVQSSGRLRRGESPPKATQLSGSSGYLWFSSADNVEVAVKVLNGCGVNGRYWVYLGGLTDRATSIAVTDTKTGTTKTYSNGLGGPFPTIQDTTTFATCP